MNARTHVLRMPSWHLINAKILFFGLSALLVAMFGLYAYLVNKTVMNVVARENVETSIAALSTSLSTMEFKYISLKNAVTLDLAYSKGFTEATPTTFINGGHTAITYNAR